ncbi:MarR family winged helix-turn-helix transcriptional regulator (plasmid) [Coraliomargarita sp. W4R53]
MQTDPSSPRESGSGAAGSSVRAATALLREFLQVNELFEKSLADELGVNSTDLQAMEHLLMSGPLRPRELARRLDISTASTTTAVDRLTALGHVTRAPDPNDKRGVLVVPSGASRERAMARLMPMIMGVDKLLDDFSDDEQRAITEYLRSVVDLYRRHAGAEPNDS